MRDVKQSLPFRWLLTGLVAAAAIVLALRLVYQSSDRPGRARPADAAGGVASSRGSRLTVPALSPHQPDVYAATTSGFSPTVRGDPELVYVPNGKQGTVEVIDPRTFKIVRRFSVGQFPEHVTRRGTSVSSTWTSRRPASWW